MPRSQNYKKAKAKRATRKFKNTLGMIQIYLFLSAILGLLNGIFFINVWPASVLPYIYFTVAAIFLVGAGTVKRKPVLITAICFAIYLSQLVTEAILVPALFVSIDIGSFTKAATITALIFGLRDSLRYKKHMRKLGFDPNDRKANTTTSEPELLTG